MQTALTSTRHLLLIWVLFSIIACSTGPEYGNKLSPNLTLTPILNVHFFCNLDDVGKDKIYDIDYLFVYKTEHPRNVSLAHLDRKGNRLPSKDLMFRFPHRFRVDGQVKDDGDYLSAWFKLTLFDFDFPDYGDYICRTKFEPKTPNSASEWSQLIQYAPGKLVHEKPGFKITTEQGAAATCIFDLQNTELLMGNVSVSIIVCEYNKPFMTVVHSNSSASLTYCSPTTACAPVVLVDTVLAIHIYLPASDIEESPHFKCTAESSNQTALFASECISLGHEAGDHSDSESKAVIALSVYAGIVTVVVVFLGMLSWYLWRVQNNRQEADAHNQQPERQAMQTSC